MFIKLVIDVFELGETIKDVTQSPIQTVAITANTGGANQSIAPINPRITSC